MEIPGRVGRTAIHPVQTTAGGGHVRGGQRSSSLAYLKVKRSSVRRKRGLFRRGGRCHLKNAYTVHSHLSVSGVARAVRVLRDKQRFLSTNRDSIEYVRRVPFVKLQCNPRLLTASMAVHALCGTGIAASTEQTEIARINACQNIVYRKGMRQPLRTGWSCQPPRRQRRR